MNLNLDQFASIVRSLMKIVAGLLAAHGLADTATFLNAPDVISAALLIASLLWSHFTHAAPVRSANSDASGSKLGLLFALLLPVLLFAGCMTSYKVQKATDITVTAAMHAWNDYVDAKHPPVAQELAVRSAWEKYQKAQLAAIDSSMAALNISPTNSLAQNFAAVDQQHAADAFNELLSLITSFGVTLPTK